MGNCQNLVDCYEFQLFKVVAENFSLWPIAILAVLVWAIRKPEHFSALFNRVESLKIGALEFKLSRQEINISKLNQSLEEVEGAEDNQTSPYTSSGPHAPEEDPEEGRQQIKILAENMDASSSILDGLRNGADEKDVLVAAEFLRTNRNYSMFKSLIACIDRIASDPKLEGLRYLTVWTLASAAHRIVLAAVKNSDIPKLSKDQLVAAQFALNKLGANPHVQKDRADNPKQGIRGPVGYALNWIEIGLKEYSEAK